jgi:mono/diheme cytochrome c family protein
MKIKTSAVLVALSVLINAEVGFAADGKALYDANCASCHGKDGTGNTAMGKKKGCKDYNDAAVQAKFTDAEATKAIKQGIPDKMKAYGDKLSDADVAALVARIREFKK